MANIREVAKLANVSVATVSRVLNKSGYVKRDTEQKIVEAMQQLHYEPSALARGLAGKSMTTIALVVPDITNPFFPELARAVEDVCQENGFTVLLCNTDDRGSKESAYIEVLKKRNIDGIIFATNSLNGRDVRSLEQRNIPFVVLDRAPAQASCSVVRSNNYRGAVLAVQHLLDIGCRKIAHIYGPQHIVTAKERLDGYMDTVRDHAWFTPNLMAPGHFQLAGGLTAANALLDLHRDIDGIFVGNDLMAVGALKALQRRGIRVPDDVALCGYDGIPITEMTEPELSTVMQPIYEMGKLSAQILIQRITGKRMMDTPPNDIYELDVTLHIRKSTQRRNVT